MLALARAQTLAKRVGGHEVEARVHGEEVDLEAELGGEGKEGEGSFGRFGSASKVRARHIGSVGLGLITWLL